MPLLESLLVQNSTTSSKSLNLSLLTSQAASLPPSLSATTAPSSTRQLVSPPTLFQPSMLLPSSSTFQPSPDCADAVGATWIDAASKTKPNANCRPKVIIPSLVPLGADSVVAEKT